MAQTPASRSLEHGPIFSWSKGHGGLIYTSGHAAVDVDALNHDPGDFEHETRTALDNLRRTLEAAGSGMDKVLKVTVYLTDMGNYARFNQVYARYFPGTNPPARTCVEVRRLPYHFKIEIEAVAHA